MFAVPDNTVPAGYNRHQSEYSEGARRSALRHPVLIAREIVADRTRWAHLLRYDPDQRFSALIARDEGQEVWLLSWLPGQGTDLHDHGTSDGAFTVVSGQLSETVVRTNGQGHPVRAVHQIDMGQSRVFGPGYVHQVSNTGPDPVISVHVYRAERAMRSYSLDPVNGALAC